MELRFGDPFEGESVGRGDCCGTYVTKSMNSLLQSAGHGELLPSENLGTGIPKFLSEKYGAPLLSREQITPETLQAMGPGTAIAYDRKEGDPGRQYGPNHAEMTRINPDNGRLMVASKSAGGGVRWKEITPQYIASLGSNATAANPFQKDEGILGKIGSFLGPSQAAAAEPPAPSGGRQMQFGEPIKMQFGEASEPPAARSTGQKLAGMVASYLGLKLPIVGMTPTQIGALALGGTAGAAAGGPAGAVAGAGLAYGAEEQAMKGLRQYAGQEPTETLAESAKGAAKDVATGATYEAAGQVGGVLAQPITEKVGQFLVNRAKGLYERVLKAPPTVPAELRDKAVQTALEGDYAVTKKGLQKLQADMDIYRQKVSEVVDQAATSGGKIDVKKVAEGLDKLKDYFGDMPFPDKFLTAIDDAKGELVRIHGREMPVDAAQRMKQRIYQVFEKYYKSRVGVDPIDVEINQAIANGIMKEIEDKVPEVARMNKEWSNKINLANLLERAVNRTRNYETLRLSDMIMATGGAAAERSVEGGFYSFLVNRVLNNPSVLSHLALKLGKNRPFVRELLTRGTAYGLTTQAKEDIEAAQPPEKIEPESKRGFTILNQ